MKQRFKTTYVIRHDGFFHIIIGSRTNSEFSVSNKEKFNDSFMLNSSFNNFFGIYLKKKKLT